MGNPGQVNYSAAKAGVIGLTKAARARLAHWNILGECGGPGLIETDMIAGISGEAREGLLQRVPLKRIGAAREGWRRWYDSSPVRAPPTSTGRRYTSTAVCTCSERPGGAADRGVSSIHAEAGGCYGKAGRGAGERDHRRAARSRGGRRQPMRSSSRTGRRPRSDTVELVMASRGVRPRDSPDEDAENHHGG